MIYVICYGITFFACLLGTICGMGGGIIIKPGLDLMGIMSVATITMLSGITVICMTCWNMAKTFLHKESVIDLKNTTPLAVGAAIGGIIGKIMFNAVAAQFEDPNMAGGVQAVLLFIATLLTMIYTLNKEKIKSRKVDSMAVCIIIGLLLGILGSFLGIGGGPFNVAVLYYFFSMKGKEAAQNSLYIILFSQTASTLKSVFSKGIPELPLAILIGMVILAIVGTEAGRKLNKKLDDAQATRCLEGAMVLIMMINVYNIIKFLVIG